MEKRTRWNWKESEEDFRSCNGFLVFVFFLERRLRRQHYFRNNENENNDRNNNDRYAETARRTGRVRLESFSEMFRQSRCGKRYSPPSMDDDDERRNGCCFYGGKEPAIVSAPKMVLFFESAIAWFRRRRWRRLVRARVRRVFSDLGEGKDGAISIGVRDGGSRYKLEVRGRGRGERAP